MSNQENDWHHRQRSTPSARSNPAFKPARTWGEYMAMSEADQKRDVAHTLRQWGMAADHTDATDHSADVEDNGRDGSEPSFNAGT